MEKNIKANGEMVNKKEMLNFTVKKKDGKKEFGKEVKD